MYAHLHRRTRERWGSNGGVPEDAVNIGSGDVSVTKTTDTANK